jgi:hypothetical protein
VVAGVQDHDPAVPDHDSAEAGAAAAAVAVAIEEVLVVAAAAEGVAGFESEFDAFPS